MNTVEYMQKVQEMFNNKRRYEKLSSDCNRDCPMFIVRTQNTQGMHPLRPTVNYNGSIYMLQLFQISDWFVGPLVWKTDHYLPNSQQLVEELAEKDIFVLHDVVSLDKDTNWGVIKKEARTWTDLAPENEPNSERHNRVLCWIPHML